ncbi:hypothetical protein M378DRAFT_159240 [Amanita muscaria Koide BX008]|uniref:Uncharacterized protein n=1 Tax=Amanita muscaria (strain Koide BX008) TaxID=946122 RepID=A0A0C2X1H8_AMAMK|nr:hypothetical protein M378DRAFT_159240 [Amanita muscaria Koide BX008]
MGDSSSGFRESSTNLPTNSTQVRTSSCHRQGCEHKNKQPTKYVITRPPLLSGATFPETWYYVNDAVGNLGKLDGKSVKRRVPVVH